MACCRRRASPGRERLCLAGWLGAFAALLLGAGEASAGSFELSWHAPVECPRAAFVEAEVARVVGRPWSELSAGWQAARASVALSSRGYQVRVTVMTHAGVERERSVAASSCTEATEAAVAILTAGMALHDPSASASDPELSNGASPATRATASTNAGATAADSASPQQPGGDAAPVHALLGASVGVDIGTLAAVAPFAQIAGGLEWGRLSALASAGATGSVIGELRGERPLRKGSPSPLDSSWLT